MQGKINASFDPSISPMFVPSDVCVSEISISYLEHFTHKNGHYNLMY